MKLTKKQKFYHDYFKRMHHSYFRNSPYSYNPMIQGFLMHKEKASAVLHKVFKANDLFMTDSAMIGNHKQSTSNKLHRIEFTFNVHNNTYIFNVFPGVCCKFEMIEACTQCSGFENIEYKSHLSINVREFDKPYVFEYDKNNYMHIELPDYVEILEQELTEESLFQYSLIYNNLPIHRLMLSIANKVQNNKNITVMQVVNVIKEFKDEIDKITKAL